MILANTLLLLSLTHTAVPLQSTSAAPSSIQLVNDEVVLHGGSDDGLPLASFMEFVEAHAGINFLVDKTLVKDTYIFLIGDQRIPKARLFETFQIHLRMKSLSLIPIEPGPLESVRSFGLFPFGGSHDGARPGLLKSASVAIAWSDLPRYAAYPAVIATTTVMSQNINVQELANTLQSYFTDPMTESVRAVSSTNSLILTGSIGTLTTMQSLIAATDKPIGNTLITKVVDIKHASAEELQHAIVAIETSSAASNLPATPMTTYVADMRTNQLIVRGPENRVNDALALIAKLDIPQEK